MDMFIKIPLNMPHFNDAISADKAYMPPKIANNKKV